jgi:FKBP-type peptidyl-prolyl cis-trans isomerase
MTTLPLLLLRDIQRAVLCAGLLTLGAPLASGAPDTASAPAAPEAAPPTFPLSAYSAFGSSLAQSGHFAELGWSQEQVSAFLEGFRAATQGKGAPMDEASSQLAAEVGRRIGQIAAAGQSPASAPMDPKVRLELYFKDMRKRLGLQVSSDGLGYNVQTGRNGVRPRPGDTIIFTARATAADGTTNLPQLSVEHLKVKFAGMMPALMEGVQMMTVGSHAVFVIPPSLSFGDGEWPGGVQHGSPLVYWVELEGVQAAPP